MDNIYKYVLKKLQDNKGKWPMIADATKIPHRSLEKYARQEIRNPPWDRIERLNKYFRKGSL